MHAAVLVAEGEPSTALKVQSDIPAPYPAPTQVRVRISHASLNHLDVWIRKGKPSVPKPRITGADACGVIDSVGSQAHDSLSAKNLQVGDSVVVDPGSGCGKCRACECGETSLCLRFTVLGEHLSGTHADFVVVPAECVYPQPAHLDAQSAAGLMLTFATAWRMLFTRAKLQKNERLLVWGASSGVGSAALELCAAAGIETIATTRSEAKADDLKQLGASHVIVTATSDDQGQNVVDSVAKITKHEGVDVAFDHLGAVAWESSMRALRRGGRYVTCGATTGANPPASITKLFWKQLSMLGSTMASRSDVESMLAFVNQHKIAPRVDRVFSLDQISDAHRYLEASSQVGKIIISLTRPT